jgi:hypothetical protein
MTELLESVIEQLKVLPAQEQDAIATRLLAELQDEQKWSQRFAETTDQQWDQIATMVRQEITSGEVTPFDEMFPLKS